MARGVVIVQGIEKSPNLRYEIEPLVRRLALLDPQAAFQLALKTGDKPSDENAAMQRVLAAIAQSLERDPNADATRAIEWANARLKGISDDEIFVGSASRLGLALANANHSDAAAALYDSALARQKTRGGAVQMESGALLAALAARLKKPEADKLYDAVFVAASQPGAAGSWPAVAANVARGSTSFARDALAQVSESQRSAALGGVIAPLATHDVAAARAVWDELQTRIKAEVEAASTREAKDAAKWPLSGAAREIVRVVGPRDPAFAETVARSDDNQWTSVALMTVAARYQAPEKALAMLREIANGDGSGMMLMALPVLAAQAAPLDRVTAEDFLDRAWKNIESSARSSGERYGIENYALALAPLDPARARMILESQVAQQKIRNARRAATQTLDTSPEARMTPAEMDAWTASSLAAAMAPFDLDRALEMARGISDEKGARSRALVQIALYVLGDEAERRRFLPGAGNEFGD